MMQYERRYNETTFTTLDGIEIVLKYAPFLLDYKSLDELAKMLKDHRRIEKQTSESIAARLEHAQQMLCDAHRMWDLLERHGEVEQRVLVKWLGRSAGDWRAISEMWEKLGLLRRIAGTSSERWVLATRLGQVVPGKCPACGGRTEAPKAMLLEATACPHCDVPVLFVLLATDTTTSAGE